MYRKQINRFLLLSLILCAGLQGTVQDDSKETSEDSESASDTFDFFDFPLAKFLKQMEQLKHQSDAEEKSEVLKKKIPMKPKPKFIEPDAEMLPAHYTGVKPPGVDHMELIIADTRGANSDDNIYVISVANAKSSHKTDPEKSDKKSEKKSAKPIKTPKTVMEHSEQRSEMKSVRNYVYENISDDQNKSEGSDGEDQSETKPEVEEK